MVHRSSDARLTPIRKAGEPAEESLVEWTYAGIAGPEFRILLQVPFNYQTNKVSLQINQNRIILADLCVLLYFF